MLFERMKNSSYTHVMYWNIAKIIIWTSWWKFSCRPLQKTVFLVNEGHSFCQLLTGMELNGPVSFLYPLYLCWSLSIVFMTNATCMCLCFRQDDHGCLRASAQLPCVVPGRRASLSAGDAFDTGCAPQPGAAGSHGGAGDGRHGLPVTLI